MKNNPLRMAKRGIAWGTFALLCLAPASALADEVRASPVKPPQQSTTATQKEPNTATLRPIAIRLEGTLSGVTIYSVGITAGYAFHPLFALEGTVAWEHGLTIGAMGRLRIPLASWSSFSLGLGMSFLWAPVDNHQDEPRTYLWLPAEVGWEYRVQEGYHFLIGVGARMLIHAQNDWLICAYCFTDSPRIYPAGRIGIGWAF